MMHGQRNIRFLTPVLSPWIINKSEHSTVCRATWPDKTVLLSHVQLSKTRQNTSHPLIRIADLSDKLSNQNGAVTHIRAACSATQTEEFVLMEIGMYTIISTYTGVAQSG